MPYTEEMTTSEILLRLASMRNELLQAVNDIEKISKNICYKAEQTENSSEKPNNCEAQTIRCPKCGRTDYIRDMEKDMGIKGSHYKYKCINCNTYIKDEATISKMEQVQQRSCDTCKGRDIEGWRNPCIGCTEFAFYEPKDELQMKVWDKAQSDCDLWQKDRTCIGCYRYDICREADCKNKSQTCDTCRNHAEMCLVSECHYEPEILIPPHHTGFVPPIKQTERSE